jgi:hypothetical protein
MKLTHWQYLAGLDGLNSECLTVSYVSKTGVCLTCGHDPNRDYKMRFAVGPLPTVPRTARIARRKAPTKGRPVPRVTRALLGCAE